MARPLPTIDPNPARTMATNIVSIAILLMGVALGGGAFLLFTRGGGGAAMFMAFLLAALAIGAVFGALAFQMVPLKADDMMEEAAAYEDEHGPYEFQD